MPTGAKMIPYLRIENLKNPTLSRGTYLYSQYMRVPPLPQALKKGLLHRFLKFKHFKYWERCLCVYILSRKERVIT